MSPAHSHVPARRVLGALAVTLGAAGLETAISFNAGSYFLVADALHLTAHLGIFAVLLLPTRGASHEAREDFLTLSVLAIILLIAASIGVESVLGLTSGAPAPSPWALLASLAGLGANLVSAWLFADPAHRHFSFRAALAHELSDAGLTVVGLFGAGLIALFGFRWVDPVLSLAITVWLTGWAVRLLVRRVRLGRAAWELERAHH